MLGIIEGGAGDDDKNIWCPTKTAHAAPNKPHLPLPGRVATALAPTTNEDYLHPWKEGGIRPATRLLLAVLPTAHEETVQ